MEDRISNFIGIFSITILVVIIIGARLSLKLSKPFFLIFGAAFAAIVAVFILLEIRRRFNSRRQQLEKQLDSEGRELRIEYSFLRKVAGVPTKFRQRELDEATDGFRSLLGRGASGEVFKGLLSDGTAVAVKRIEGEDRGEKAFKAEVEAIASVQHVNLVRLLGYCVASSGLRFLVYDFIPNGSLDHWIFPRLRGGGCLSWEMRQQVAVDVAKALSYLHHDCRSCVLHLDVKPENILLDQNHRALVTDFGLSKLKGRDESRVVTTIRGTRGYLAPEWLLENGISEKSDVYSYGMVLLEIIGGRRGIYVLDNTSKRKFEFFPKIVAEKLREGKLMEVVDERLMLINDDGKLIREDQVHRMALIALWCIQEKAKLRPSMKEVVEMLENRVAINDPPDLQMLVVDLLSIDENDDRNRKPRFVQMDRDYNSTPGCSFSFSMLTGR